MQAFIRYLSVTLVLVTMVACGDRKNKEADRILDSADALMTEHPDSALSLIEKIDTVGLDEEHFARYALLLTKAQDKNYIDPADDRLILKAVDFYQGKNNSEETQALYYYGYATYCRDSLRQSIPIISKCYNMACEQSDWFYQGMSARLLSDIYKCICMFPEELDYAHKAQDAFLQYEKAVSDSSHERSSWMTVYIAEALNNNKEYESVIELCNNSDSLLMLDDSSFRHLILINKAQALSKSGMSDSCIAIYRNLMADGYDMKAYNWCRLSESYLRKHNLTAGRQFLDSAKTNLDYRADTLYVAMLENLMAGIEGNKDSILRFSTHYNNVLTDISNDALIGIPLSDITENYTSELYDIKSESAYQTLLTTLGILGLTGIIILIIWFGRKVAKKKDSEITSLSEQTELLRIDVKNLTDDNNLLRLDRLSAIEKADELKKQIVSLQLDCKNLSESLTKNISGEIGSLTKEERYLVKKRLSRLDKLCKDIFLFPNKTTANQVPSKLQMEIIADMRSEHSLEYYDLIIDLYSDGFFKLLKDNYPNLKLRKLRLARYLYAGFCLEAIMFLMNYDTRNKLDSAKWHLKRTLLNNANLRGLTHLMIFKTLKIKYSPEKVPSKLQMEIIADMRSEHSLEYYDLIIDLYSDGFFKLLKDNYPNLKLRKLRLARYLYAGFCLEAIMFLMNYDTRNKLDSAKWHLKRTLLNNANLRGLTHLMIFKTLKIKYSPESK